MTTINVTVAAYRMFAEARADWDAFELSVESSSSQLVDAALIELRGGQISEFHCLSASGWGRGIIASAICCVLWPPAMVVGALAGSVGRHTMTEIRRGLSREAIGGLGAVMEMGAFFEEHKRFHIILHRSQSPIEIARQKPFEVLEPYTSPASPWTHLPLRCARHLTSTTPKTDRVMPSGASPRPV